MSFTTLNFDSGSPASRVAACGHLVPANRVIQDLPPDSNFRHNPRMTATNRSKSLSVVLDLSSNTRYVRLPSRLGS